MKTIAINSIKGGTGKSTLAALLIKALTGAGFKFLAIDADSSNHSVSFFLNEHEEANPVQGKTVFRLFMGEPVRNYAKRINEKQRLKRREHDTESNDEVKKRRVL